MTLEIAEPTNAFASEICFECLRKQAWIILAAGQGQARIKTGLYGEQHRYVRNIAGHRTGHAELLEKDLFAGTVGHATGRGTKAKDIIKGSRGA